jgi:hypothetical protein
LRAGALRAGFVFDCGRGDDDLTMEPRILIAPGPLKITAAAGDASRISLPCAIQTT